jgi:23S rRNA (uracil1939-C5)-methyltransferase
VCGGCSFQHVASDKQISIKQELLLEQFKRIGKVSVTELWSPMTANYWGYRRKARLGVKYVAKKDRVLVGFRERRQQYLADMDNCLVLHPLIGTQLTTLGAMLKQLSIREYIPQIEVAIGDNQCVLAIRVLQEPTTQDLAILREFEQQHGMILCLQTKGVDTITPLSGDKQHALLTYALSDYDLEFVFKPAMFTQVNAEINRLMMARVLETLALNKDDTVLDLFCGLGNFTLPMARYAGQVVGVEGDLPLVNHAKENAERNNMTNVEFYAADLSKDISQFEWARRQYNKLLLDPSRAGAFEVLTHIKTWNPEQIVYVSCNPSTLARDAGVLVNELGYSLVKAGVMDMFPQTSHVESMALFVRN